MTENGHFLQPKNYMLVRWLDFKPYWHLAMPENGHFFEPKNDMLVVGFQTLLSTMTENVFQNPKLFPMQVSLSPKQST
jgi:hypothetical protein